MENFVHRPIKILAAAALAVSLLPIGQYCHHFNYQCPTNSECIQCSDSSTSVYCACRSGCSHPGRSGHLFEPVLSRPRVSPPPPPPPPPSSRRRSSSYSPSPPSYSSYSSSNGANTDDAGLLGGGGFGALFIILLVWRIYARWKCLFGSSNNNRRRQAPAVSSSSIYASAPGTASVRSFPPAPAPMAMHSNPLSSMASAATYVPPTLSSSSTSGGMGACTGCGAVKDSSQAFYASCGMSTPTDAPAKPAATAATVATAASAAKISSALHATVLATHTADIEKATLI